ncbi:MAG: hypothetical protein R2839_07275 [Thermomicrobiales bacterium]
MTPGLQSNGRAAHRTVNLAIDLDGVLTEHPRPLAVAASDHFGIDLPERAFVDSAGLNVPTPCAIGSTGTTVPRHASMRPPVPRIFCVG